MCAEQISDGCRGFPLSGKIIANNLFLPSFSPTPHPSNPPIDHINAMNFISSGKACHVDLHRLENRFFGCLGQIDRTSHHRFPDAYAHKKGKRKIIISLLFNGLSNDTKGVFSSVHFLGNWGQRSRRKLDKNFHPIEVRDLFFSLVSIFVWETS